MSFTRIFADMSSEVSLQACDDALVPLDLRHPAALFSVVTEYTDVAAIASR